MAMTTTAIRKWTPEEIAAIFREAFDETDDANREATSGPHNPYGDAYDDLTWHGTIEEARSDRSWPKTDPEDYEEGEEPDTAALAIEQASNVVGTGRPIYAAFCDGAFPAVFCEDASEADVRAAVWQFYPRD